MATVIGSKVAGRHGAGPVAKRLHLVPKQEARDRAWHGLLKAQSSLLRDIHPLTRPHLLMDLQTNPGPSLQL